MDDIHTIDHADGLSTDGDCAADPTLQSSTRGGDNVNTADAPTHGVGFQHLWSPYCGTQDTRCRDTTPHVTPGGGGDSACRSCYDGDPYRSRSDESCPLSLNTTTNQKGGPIVLPRASNRERLAHALKTSCNDMASLAHLEYHGGPNGEKELTIKFIHECGYDSISVDPPENILISYNDIILAHRKVVTGWTNYRTGRSGPIVEYIIEKALVNFPKLRSLDAQAAVEIYDKLQNLSTGYLLPLMTFDAIKLSFSFEGICLPGLGTHRYAEVCSAIMDILPLLLLTTSSKITSAIATVGFESNNGYDLLWRILDFTVPGFDPTVPILPPTWYRDPTCSTFAKLISCTFACKPRRINTSMRAPTPPSSCVPSRTPNTPTLSCSSKHKSIPSATPAMLAIFPATYTSAAS